MLIEKELEKIFHDLVTLDKTQVFLSENDVTISSFDHASKLILTTPIYFGGNYIPQSVRHGITKTPPFERCQTIKTFFTVDEGNFRIFLNFRGTTDDMNNKKFIHLLEDFCYLADEWRIYLDEHDKNDLIYIKAR